MVSQTVTHFYSGNKIVKYIPHHFPKDTKGSPNIAKGTNITNLIYFIETKLLTYNRRAIFLTKQNPTTNTNNNIGKKFNLHLLIKMDYI